MDPEKGLFLSFFLVGYSFIFPNLLFPFFLSAFLFFFLICYSCFLCFFIILTFLRWIESILSLGGKSDRGVQLQFVFNHKKIDMNLSQGTLKKITVRKKEKEKQTQEKEKEKISFVFCGAIRFFALSSFFSVSFELTLSVLSSILFFFFFYLLIFFLIFFLEFIDQYLDPGRQEPDGRRTVTRISINGNCFHIKEYPESPSIEFAVRQLKKQT